MNIGLPLSTACVMLHFHYFKDQFLTKIKRRTRSENGYIFYEEKQEVEMKTPLGKLFERQLKTEHSMKAENVIEMCSKTVKFILDAYFYESLEIENVKIQIRLRKVE